MPLIEQGINSRGETREQALWSRLRLRRNELIAETDYLLSPDYPIDNVKLNFVKQYRQALRDITKEPGAPFDGGGPQTPWPEKNW